MSRVLRGSSAELPPTKYRSLDRKISAGCGGGGGTNPSSPRYSSISSASPPSSLLSTPLPPSTPVRSGSRNSALMSPGGRRCGSLPRNPRGKMPLYGKVAGYKQPAAAAVASPDHAGYKLQPVAVAVNSPDHAAKQAGFMPTNLITKVKRHI